MIETQRGNLFPDIPFYMFEIKPLSNFKYFKGDIFIGIINGFT